MAAEPLRSSPEKQRAPSNRRAESRFRNQQGGDECLHRVEWYERVNRERQRLTETAGQDRELREAAEQEHRRPGERGDPTPEQRARTA